MPATAGTLTRDDVEIVDHQIAYRGYFRIDRYRLRHRAFAGGWSGEMVREVFERGHAVGVLLYDPGRAGAGNDRVVLIEQFRIGAYTAGWQPWLTEVVAGIIDPDESPEQVARRETFEETGCEALDLVHICDYLASPGGTSETISLFCARVDSAAAGEIRGLAHEHEDIRVKVLSADEALALLEHNRLGNAVTIIALAWFARHREALRQRWSGAAR
jgi:ADP-ribose pyrophosphatase